MSKRIKRRLQQSFAVLFTLLLLSQSIFTAFAQDSTQETTDDGTTQETQSDDNSGSGNSDDRDDDDDNDNSGPGGEDRPRDLPPRSLDEDRPPRHDGTQESMEMMDKMEDGEGRRPHIREGLAERRQDMKHRAAFALVQWGYIENAYESKDPFEWNGSMTVSEGAGLKLIRGVLFEKNDSVSQDSEGSPINIAAVTTVHWDGLLVRVKPRSGTGNGESDDATTLTVALNNTTLEVSMRELYENGKVVADLDDGRQIVIRNFSGPRHLRDEVRERVFDAKDKGLGAQARVEEFIKKLLEEGKITDEQYIRLQEAFSELFEQTLTEGQVARLIALFRTLYDQLQNGELSVDILIEKIEALTEQVAGSGQQEKFEEGIIPFCDTGENDWFTEDVQFLKDSDIVSGDAGKCTFRPGDSVSRAELLKMALEAAGDAGLLPSEAEAESDAPEDSRGHWGKRYIAYALGKGDVSGYNDGFRPNQAVTRAEAIKIILNVLGLAPDRPDSSEELASAFPDTEGHWGAAIIAYAKQLGIVSGDSETGEFRPNAPLNRAEAAKIIRAAIDAIVTAEADL